jgi:Family of unknown function (DUF6152)
MKRVVFGVLAAGLALLLRPAALMAHHEILAKFDNNKKVTLRGFVTEINWKNPHAHLFMDVRDGNAVSNWAIELESPVDLEKAGWKADSLKPGDAITVLGIAARDGSRQAWADSAVMTNGGKKVFDVRPPQTAPVARPSTAVPRTPDGHPRLGSEPGQPSGYWANPSSTYLVENGVKVLADEYGLLRNVADAPKIAPLQKWALDLYTLRQRNFLKDDPMFLFCKPPGGPRQFQTRYGAQFLEDVERKRIFVLIGGGNRNFRIVYMDGRGQTGRLNGDADNPLYYGRSIGKWEGDTLVVDTKGFNEAFWFTNGGLPHTDQLHLVERFTRSDATTLKYEVTIDDRGAYNRTWSSGWTMQWVQGPEMPPYFCQDNRP